MFLELLPSIRLHSKYITCIYFSLKYLEVYIIIFICRWDSKRLSKLLSHKGQWWWKHDTSPLSNHGSEQYLINTLCCAAMLVLQNFPHTYLFLYGSTRPWKLLSVIIMSYVHWCFLFWLGFPGDSGVKNLPANAGDTGDVGSIPGLRRSPGEGNGNPFQYYCLEIPIDRGAWQTTIRGITKIWTQLSTHALFW